LKGKPQIAVILEESMNFSPKKSKCWINRKKLAKEIQGGGGRSGLSFATARGKRLFLCHMQGKDLKWLGQSRIESPRNVTLKILQNKNPCNVNRRS